MPLPLQTFDQIVAAQNTAMQANSNVILNINQGSVIEALVEANAGNSIWLQALATTLLAITRLSTSSGNDVDTFIADFGFSRYQGNAASGNITFSRFTDTVTGTVPVGTQISATITTISGTVQSITYTVTLDTTNPAYNAGLNAYVIAISTPSLTVPCVCNITGTIGNVVIGAINTINAPNTTPGFDTVSNSAAYTNGANPWSDTQTKQEFLLYINSLSRATLQAIQFAVSTSTNGSEVVTRYNIVENVNESGSPQLGFFYVVIDNGTGSPCSDALKTIVTNNVENYRGLTIEYAIDKATFIAITITVFVNFVSNPTETIPQIIANIKSALQAYAASIPFNQPFLYNDIAQVVLTSDPNVLNIPTSSGNNPVLNGGNSDIAGNNLQVFGIPSITVNHP